MFSGYLTKRDSPQSPPSMQKVFCVLWGTMLLDYENEDDAKTLMNPKLVVELVGVSEWDGKGRANNYPAGLLLVTRTRRNYFASCSSVQERDEWILHFKRSLECSFANNEIAPFRPSSIIQSRISTDARNTKCPRTDYQVNSYSPKCNSCGRRFYSSEHVSELCVLAQLGCEESEKVCLDCKNAQMCILWLKTMNYVQIMDLHELSDSVLTNVKKFHASFQLRRRLSQRLDMAGELYSNGSLTTEEFEELRSVDHAYRREVQHDECLKLKQAIEVFGEDLQTVLNILMNDSMTSKGGRNAYFTLILRVLELADHAPDLVDFYFPQLYQIHLQQLLNRTPDSYIKVDCLQQALLVLAKKFPSFGLKLNWSLMATIGDYQEKRATQVQYAACMSLLLQLEMVMMGQISCIADVPTSKVLHQVLRPAPHQQQEIGFEISMLFLIRRQLQEAYDAEEERRKDRNRKLYGDCNPDLVEEKETAAKKMKPLPVYPGTNHTCSCIELLYHLGVGQAPSRTPGISGQGDQDVANVENSSSDSNPISFWDGFDRQIDFLGRINALVDHLRFIDRPLRAETLKAQLHKWNNYGRRRDSRDGRQRRSKSTNSIASNGTVDQEGHSNLSNSDHSSSYRVSNPATNSANINGTNAGSISPIALSNSMPSIDDLQAAARTSRSQSRHKQSHSDGIDEEPIIVDHNPKLGWDPTTIAGEPQYRITRIIVDECRVFRTKARAPTMIVCEVIRDDVYRQQHATVSLNNDRSSFSKSPSSSILNKESTLVVNNPEGVIDYDADEAMTGLFIDSPMYQSQVHTHGTSSMATRERSASMSVPKMAFANNHNINLNLNQSVDQSHVADNVSFSDPGQSLQDVDSLIESSLNPVIAEMQLHRKQQQQEDQQEQNPPAPVSTSPVTPQQARAGAISTTVQALPRRRSGGILPTNRLSASTEGILRSSSNINLTVNGIAASASSTVLDSNDNNNDASDSASAIEEELVAKDPNLQHIVISAQRLLKDGTISDREYRQLIMSDLHYREEIAREAALIEKSRVENVLGESFQSKKERILGSKLERRRSNSRSRTLSNSSQGMHSVSLHRITQNAPSTNNSSSSTNGNKNNIASPSSNSHEDHSTVHENFWPSYDLRSFIVKTNDDLRQEICCMQMMQIFKEIFDHFSLSHMLFLKPYRIISTGSSSGVIEVLQDAVSLDALKHTSGFTTLANHFNTVYNTTPERLQRAKHNFMASLAAYSLFSYLLLVKDRHNGNLLIDSEGHIIHIDFGFILSIAPGGSFSVETAPFKLTEEMVELLDGLDSPLFGEFVTAFTKGFIALQANCENILSAITILSHNSSFPCFRDKPVVQILDKLRARFRTELNVQDAVKHCLDLITNSYGHYGTRQYDQFQYFTNGILA